MNVKTTVVLVLLLALVGVSFYFMRQHDDSASDTTTAPRAGDGHPVFTADKLDTSRVTQIRIEKDGKVVELAKEDGQWLTVAPARWPVNDYSVTNILDSAAALAYVERFEPGSGGKPTLKDVKLDPPYGVITLTEPADDQQESRSHTIRLSSRPVGGTGYALIDDDSRIYVVKDALHQAALQPDPKTWRRKQFDTPTANQTQSLTLHRGDDAITAHRHDSGWFLGDGQSQRADAQAIAGVIEAVKAIYIDEFTADAADNLAIYGLSDPSITLQLTRQVLDDSTPTTHMLRVGGPADLEDKTYYATWSTGDEPSGVVFKIKASAVQALRPNLDDLRDPTVTPTPRYEIAVIHIDRPDQPAIDLVKEGTGYTFGEPNPGYAVDREAGDALLDALLNTEAVGYTDAAGNAEPVATITLKRRGIDEPDTIKVYPDEDATQVVTHRDGEAVGYRVKRADLAPIFEPLLALRERTVLDLSADELTALQVEGRGGAFRFERGEGDAWMMNGGAAYDKPAFTDLRNLVTSMRADRWLPEPIEMEAPLTLTVERKEAGTLVLALDPDTGHAMLTGIDTAFVLPPDAIETLTAEFRDRSVLPLSIDQISAITIEGHDQSLELSRGTDGSYRLNGSDEADSEAAAGLFDAVAGLTAVRYHEPSVLGDKLDAPTFTLTIQPKTGQRMKLRLWAPQTNRLNVPMSRLDDAKLVFELTAEEYAKMTADPRKKAS